jgi:hypothetical protein
MITALATLLVSQLARRSPRSPRVIADSRSGRWHDLAFRSDANAHAIAAGAW